MNPIQEAIAEITGVSSLVSEMEKAYNEKFDEFQSALEQVDGQNALLIRQIEDIDYLNLFDFNNLVDVIPLGDRKKQLLKMRRMRHENPLAKQSVQLIKRFTLGKGVEMVVGPDPELKTADMTSAEPPQASLTGPKVNGLFPGNRPNPKTGDPLLPRKRPQIGESVEAQIDTAIVPLDTSDPIKDFVFGLWKDPDNQLALFSRAAMLEWLDAVVTDGEYFFLCYEGETAPYIKLSEMPIEEIDSIVYDPNNRLRPVYYRRSFKEMEYDGKTETYRPSVRDPKILYYLDYRITQEDLDGVDGDQSKPGLNKTLKIPQSKQAPIEQRIFPCYINPIWTKKGKRGISELYASREWFRVYKEFMEDRAAINAAATAVAYKRKVKAGPSQVARISGSWGGRPMGFDNPDNTTILNKLGRPVGAGIHDSNEAVDLEWMKTDTGAQNAKDDGRSILTAAGAGMGMFQHYFGDGGDANLATAQAMELPMVKTFEDWQQWTEDVLVALAFYVIRKATDLEQAQKHIDRVGGSFPPIISQDVVKYMTAWSQFVQNVAPGNKIVHKEAIKGAFTVMNTPNIDALMNEVEAEEVRLEVERQAQRQAMLDNLANPQPPAFFGNGNGNGKPQIGKGARDGSGNALPPDLKTVVKGKPEPARNGPKPA